MFLRDKLGEAFISVELPDEAANPDALLAPYSVLTDHLIDVSPAAFSASDSIV